MKDYIAVISLAFVLVGAAFALYGRLVALETTVQAMAADLVDVRRAVLKTVLSYNVGEHGPSNQ